jgi:predicted phage-related endonuclease
MHAKFNSEAEWLALREANVGGSEVAALFNVWRAPDGSEIVRHLYETPGEGEIMLGSLSPYSTGYRLYCEKTGQVMPEDLARATRVIAGQFLEPAIAAWAKSRWPDWGLLKSRVYHLHPTVPGWGASLDYFTQRGGEPVDVKNVDGLVFKNKWVVEDGEIVNWPLHIVLQVQHQIACKEAEAGWVLTCVGGNELFRGRIPRHQPTIDKIEVAVRAFWEAVAAGAPPPDVDYDTVKEVYAVGFKDTTVDLTADESAGRAARRYSRWTRHAKFVEGQIELIKGRVAASLGDKTRATIAGGRVTWPVINRQPKSYMVNLTEKTYRGGLSVTLEEPTE